MYDKETASFPEVAPRCWAGDNEYWSQVAAGDCCSRPVWRGVSGTILTTAAPLLSLNWPPELSTLSTEHWRTLDSAQQP